jgi:hypothetical protein
LAGALVGLGVLLACGSNSSSSNSGGLAPLACNGPFDGGFRSGPVSESQNLHCGGSLKGTKQPGDACQSNSECAPTCCACATGSNSAEVAWCNSGLCASPNDTCCVFQYVQTNDFSGDGGIAGVCSR